MIRLRNAIAERALMKSEKKLTNHFRVYLLLCTSALLSFSCAKYRITGGSPKSPIEEPSPLPFTSGDGFVVVANPNSAEVNTQVAFTLAPACSGLATLNFGDGISSAEKIHIYTAAGTYIVYAECQEAGSETRKKSANLSLVITGGRVADPTQQSGGGSGGCPQSCW